MCGQLLNLIYLCLLAACSPLLIWKSLSTGKYRSGWREKLFGQLPTHDAADNVIWFHAVSVGEVLQLRQIVDVLRRHLPGANCLISTTTDTGFQVAKEKFADCQVTYFPLDFTWSTERSLNRVQPKLIVLVELELWPNFIWSAARKGIPIVIINGRLSERSFHGYQQLKWLMKSIWSALTMIAVQNDEYRQRFIDLGCPSERVRTLGSIKFDGVQTERDNPRTQQLRRWWGLPEGVPVFIAGSTQEPEEELALAAYETTRQEFPELRLIIVPRHPERRIAIRKLIEERGWKVCARTDEAPEIDLSDREAVGLLDTVGELGACWGLADVAFVGGSFGSRGGQNMLEPAGYAAAVCFGPNTKNFRQVVDLLLQAEAAVRVHDRIELQDFLVDCLRHQERRESLGKRAQQLVLSHQGATQRTVELLLQLLQQRHA